MACLVEECASDSRTIRRGMCVKHYQRWIRHGDPGALLPTGPSRGDSYSAAHSHVRRDRGLATDRACLHCGGGAHQWAYDHEDPDELNAGRPDGLPLRYSLDVQHYIPLCRPCHAAFDRGARNERPCREIAQELG